MTTLAALQSLIAQGESETLELKRSTAELQRVGQTLRAFLNGEGGYLHAFATAREAITCGSERGDVF